MKELHIVFDFITSKSTLLFCPASMALMKGIFNFERKAVLNLFIKIKNSLTISCIRGQHHHKNNNDKYPNNQLQKACNCFEFFTDVVQMSVAFSPVQSVPVPSSIMKLKNPQALSFTRNVFTQGMNEIFSTLTSNFLVEFQVR